MTLRRGSFVFSKIKSKNRIVRQRFFVIVHKLEVLKLQILFQMDLVPQAPSIDVLRKGHTHVVAKYLHSFGDPNFSHTVDVVVPIVPYVPKAGQTSGTVVSYMHGNETSISAALSSLAVERSPCSAMQLACLWGQQRLVATLLDEAQRRLDLSASPASRLPAPLFVAVMLKDPLLWGVGLLSSAAALPQLCPKIKITDTGDVTPSLGDVATVHALLMRHADPNGSDGDSSSLPVSPLHLALMQDHEPIVSALLQAGASISCELRGLLLAACVSCSVAGLLMMRRGREEATDALLSLPLDRHGRTALHYAAMAVLDQDCLYEGANIDVYDRRENFCRLVAFLGCPVDAKESNNGDTALHIAWKLGRGRLVRVFVEELGADVTVENAAHQLPLESHELQMSSIGMAFCGGVCEIDQDSGKMSSLGFAQFLLTSVYPSYTPMQLRPVVGAAVVDGQTPLHRLCSNEPLLHSASVSDIVDTLRLVVQAAQRVEGGGDDSSLLTDWLHHEASTSCGMSLSPLCAAVCEGNAPMEVLQLLVASGCDPTRPSGPLHRRRNALQLLAAEHDPPPHAADAALLFLHASQKDISREALNNLQTHPDHPHLSMLDLPVVQSHPHWQRFYERLVAPRDEKERRERERQRFEQFRCGVARTLVAEIEPLPDGWAPPPTPVNDSVVLYSSVATPLDRGDDTQGAYVVCTRPMPILPPPHRDCVPPAADDVTTRTGALRSTVTSFQQKVTELMEHHYHAQLSSRDFFHEARNRRPSSVDHDEDVKVMSESPQRDLDSWVSSVPEASALQAFFLVWMARENNAMLLRSSAVVATKRMQRYQQATRLARKRHGALRSVEEDIQCRFTRLGLQLHEPLVPSKDAPQIL